MLGKHCWMLGTHIKCGRGSRNWRPQSAKPSMQSTSLAQEEKTKEAMEPHSEPGAQHLVFQFRFDSITFIQFTEVSYTGSIISFKKLCPSYFIFFSKAHSFDRASFSPGCKLQRNRALLVRPPKLDLKFYYCFLEINLRARGLHIHFALARTNYWFLDHRPSGCLNPTFRCLPTTLYVCLLSSSLPLPLSHFFPSPGSGTENWS